MKGRRFQNRLIYSTIAVTAAIFIVAMVLIYIGGRRQTLAKALNDEQTDLNRNVELLAVMLRQGVSLDEVKSIATAPWDDGSGNYFIIDDAASTNLALKPGDHLLTAHLEEGDVEITLGEIVSERRMLRSFYRLLNYFVVFAIVVLLVLAQSVRHAVKRLSQPEVERQRRIDSELEIARRIQDGMLPNAAATPPQVELGTLISPSKEVGGDFFNYFIAGGRFHFIIADVSGKGVPAALYMSLATKLYASIASEDREPCRTASLLNEALCADNTASMFTTAVICRLDPATGVVEICNAGHTSPLLLTPGRKPEFLKGENNIALGVVNGFRYEQYQVCLAPGSHLLLYTDGVTEAEDRRLHMFGLERLVDAVKGADADAQSLVEALKKRIDAFADGRQQADDITILDMKYVRRELRMAPSLSDLPTMFAFCAACGLDDKATLAVEEAVVNVINHSAAADLSLRCDVNADGVVKIVISDDGRPFNPLVAPEKTEADLMHPGGHGLTLIKALTESVDYSRENNRNILTLTIKDNGLSV